VRRNQTAAIGRAVRSLVDERRLWLVDAGALAFPGLEGIPHGFEHPANYELAMLLDPGDQPPLALELARAIGMSSPSLSADRYGPELSNLVDPAWAARHPSIEIDMTVQCDAGAALDGSQVIWGPIRIERRDITAEDDAGAREAVLDAVDEVAGAAEAGRLVLPGLAERWVDVEMTPDQLTFLRVRHRWIAAAAFRQALERRGARHLQSVPSFFQEFFRHRGVVAKVSLQWWADQEWLRSVTLALP
jgi:hypothetical protein